LPKVVQPKLPQIVIDWLAGLAPKLERPLGACLSVVDLEHRRLERRRISWGDCSAEESEPVAKTWALSAYGISRGIFVRHAFSIARSVRQPLPDELRVRAPTPKAPDRRGFRGSSLIDTLSTGYSPGRFGSCEVVKRTMAPLWPMSVAGKARRSVHEGHGSRVRRTSPSESLHRRGTWTGCNRPRLRLPRESGY